MRVAAPKSLLLLTLIHNDERGVVVLGPFSSISCMDDKLTGEHYPHGSGAPDTTLAHYCQETKSWWSVGGSSLIMWTVQSVDEVLHRGHKTEKAKAGYVVSEFPAEGDAKEG